MHFGHFNNCFQYKLNDTNLEISNCGRILGGHIDNKLTFANHVYMYVLRKLVMFIIVFCLVYTILIIPH